MLRVFLNGLSTGLVLQLAIGPVFFYILNISLQRTLIDGILSVFAVTIVDYCYILLAIIGVGKLLEKKTIKKRLEILSSAVLFIFGIIMLFSARNILADNTLQDHQISNYWYSFLSTFMLTISSPMTIVFWTSLFASKAMENEYIKRQLVIFGISAGLATPIFLGSAVIMFSLLQASIPIFLVKLLNAAVGLLLVLYGVIRLFNVLKDST